MTEPWHNNRGDDKPADFWLDFQVLNDGLGAAADEDDNTSTSTNTVNHNHDGGDDDDGSGAPQDAVANGLPPPPPPQAAGFPRFGELPAELRLKIWACLVQPRVVAAVCVTPQLAARKRAQLARRPRRPHVPVLLLVNRESRDVGLRHYELTFSWRIPRQLFESAASSSASSSTSASAAFSSSSPAQAGAGAGAVGAAGKDDGGVIADNSSPPWHAARVWFSFELDALLLLGELEVFDEYGINSSMVYFLKKEDTSRVRHVACAFEELRPKLYRSAEMCGTLFHVVDRFSAAKRLLITSTREDIEVDYRALPMSDNMMQKMWWLWINGTSVVTSSLANTQILMIREDDLHGFVSEHN